MLVNFNNGVAFLRLCLEASFTDAPEQLLSDCLVWFRRNVVRYSCCLGQPSPTAHDTAGRRFAGSPNRFGECRPVTGSSKADEKQRHLPERGVERTRPIPFVR